MASRTLPFARTFLLWGVCLCAGLECSPKPWLAESAVMQNLAELDLEKVLLGFFAFLAAMTFAAAPLATPPRRTWRSEAAHVP